MATGDSEDLRRRITRPEPASPGPASRIARPEPRRPDTDVRRGAPPPAAARCGRMPLGDASGDPTARTTELRRRGSRKLAAAAETLATGVSQAGETSAGAAERRRATCMPWSARTEATSALNSGKLIVPSPSVSAARSRRASAASVTSMPRRCTAAASSRWSMLADASASNSSKTRRSRASKRSSGTAPEAGLRPRRWRMDRPKRWRVSWRVRSALDGVMSSS